MRKGPKSRLSREGLSTLSTAAEETSGDSFLAIYQVKVLNRIREDVCLGRLHVAVAHWLAFSLRLGLAFLVSMRLFYIQQREKRI